MNLIDITDMTDADLDALLGTDSDVDTVKKMVADNETALGVTFPGMVSVTERPFFIRVAICGGSFNAHETRKLAAAKKVARAIQAAVSTPVVFADIVTD